MGRERERERACGRMKRSLFDIMYYLASMQLNHGSFLSLYLCYCLLSVLSCFVYTDIRVSITMTYRRTSRKKKGREQLESLKNNNNREYELTRPIVKKTIGITTNPPSHNSISIPSPKKRVRRKKKKVKKKKEKAKQ